MGKRSGESVRIIIIIVESSVSSSSRGAASGARTNVLRYEGRRALCGTGQQYGAAMYGRIVAYICVCRSRR
eukprot:6198991-Pleurochrysis_carterae.AAC.1